MMDKCAGCGGALPREEPYVYVYVQGFRRHLEPAPRLVYCYHASCYTHARLPSWDDVARGFSGSGDEEDRCG